MENAAEQPGPARPAPAGASHSFFVPTQFAQEAPEALESEPAPVQKRRPAPVLRRAYPSLYKGAVDRAVVQVQVENAAEPLTGGSGEPGDGTTAAWLDERRAEPKQPEQQQNESKRKRTEQLPNAITYAIHNQRTGSITYEKAFLTSSVGFQQSGDGTTAALRPDKRKAESALEPYVDKKSSNWSIPKWSRAPRHSRWRGVPGKVNLERLRAKIDDGSLRHDCNKKEGCCLLISGVDTEATFELYAGKAKMAASAVATLLGQNWDPKNPFAVSFEGPFSISNPTLAIGRLPGKIESERQLYARHSAFADACLNNERSLSLSSALSHLELEEGRVQTESSSRFERLRRFLGKLCRSPSRIRSPD